MSTTPSTQRNALFDDTPVNAGHVPGALHLTTDDHIERLIARSGAIALVRQLAADLAQRDAQATTLRRRSEERERILRKMLLEREVPNMDIESRLSAVEKSLSSTEHKKKSMQGEDEDSLADSIDEMMGQAMSDEVGLEAGFMDKYLGSAGSDSERQQPKLRASGKPASEDDSRTKDAAAAGKMTTKGWKDYILGSTGPTRLASTASSVASGPSDDTKVTSMVRVSSSGGPRRKGLQSDLFHPPETRPNRSSSRTASLKTDVQHARTSDDNDSDAHSTKSASSVTAWALKLVAGNNQAAKKEVPPPKDARSARDPATSSSSRAPSAGAPSIRTGRAGSGDLTVRRATQTSQFGPSGTVKASAPSNLLSLGSSPHVSEMLADSNNSGPVEMDTILPPGSRPPTLTQTYNDHHPSEFLTDRFGFIYDQRRRRRQKEAAENPKRDANTNGRMEMLSPSRENFGAIGADAESDSSSIAEDDSSRSDSRPGTAASNGEEPGASKPTKGWQDYLKIATFPTELLSHTPSSTAMPVVQPVEEERTSKPSHIVVEGRGPQPSASVNPQPLTSPIVSSNATFAKPALLQGPPSPLPAKEQPEPVKLLLEQLTELHDSLQRDRTVKWNEFLRKVRAERRKTGEAAAATEGSSKRPFMPEVSLADGEMVGVAGLGNRGKVGRAKWNEFKRLVLGGIPVAYRAKIWAECSGASALRVPGQYDDLVKNGVDDAEIVSQIAMDIHRTLTDNVFFRKGPGVAKLNEVLLAYSHRNVEVGYCQGMNLIAASLLLIMPTAEDAFWVLASMIENILPPKYYDHSLLASRADQQVLRLYVAELLPNLSAHLDGLGIELEALTFQWFLSVFTDCLSAEALFRVWDVVLCTNDGSTFLFQVALALLKLNEGALLECRAAAAAYAYINHQMTNHAISIDGLIQASDALKRVVRRDDVEERRARVVAAEAQLLQERAERNRTRPTASSAALPLQIGADDSDPPAL